MKIELLEDLDSKIYDHSTILEQFIIKTTLLRLTEFRETMSNANDFRSLLLQTNTKVQWNTDF
jgi:hypothetical protein